MKKLLFNYSNTVEYDKILATEVYPAIAKAFGVLAEDKDSALLIAAAEHLTDSVDSFCKSLCDGYMLNKVNDRELEKFRGAFLSMNTFGSDSQNFYGKTDNS